MRDLINLSEGALFEGATIYPARKETMPDGGILIGWPDEFVNHVEIPCRDCDGTGEIRGGTTCPYCRGTKVERDTEYNFPNISAGYATIRVLAELMGEEPDESGWIPPEKMPELRRRLIRLKNTSVSGYTREPSEERQRRVDRSGDIPQISSGPLMIDMGLSGPQVERMIDRLLELIDWAQKHDCGLSWA